MGISERKERDRERRRNEILDAAERLIFKNGFENTTVESVANAAELSKATLYLYFKSKEELHHAVFLRGHKLMYGLIDEELLSADTTRSKIAAFFRAIVRFHREYPDYFNVFFYFLTNKFQQDEEDCACKQNDELDMIYLNKWAELVSQGKEEGTIRKDLEAIPAVLILWMQLLGFLKMLSVQQQFMEKMCNTSEEEILRQYFDLITAGIIINHQAV